MPKPDQMAAGENGQQTVPAEPGTMDEFGLTMTPADDGRGVVVTDVEPGSDAEDRGIQAGDVIRSVNSNPVGSVSDVEKAVDEAGKAGRKAVLLQVERNGQNRFVALPVLRG